MKKSLFLTGCSISALALAFIPLAAQAQSQPAAPADSSIETVTVTGVIGAVSGALNIKQNSGQMVDAIVSEDIGKLPDSTVVESLQHVTGISIVRNSVESSTVLIRGLPDVQTTLNGREIFTSTGRALSLPDIPSELLARVDVDKTSTATDLEGGIAGLIDVRLHRPFDFEGPEVAATVQAQTESLAKHIDPQGSLLVSNRWNTDIGEIGLLADVSYKDPHTRTDAITKLSPYMSNVVGPVPGAGAGPGTVCTLGPACPVETAGQTATKTVSYAQGVAPGYAGQTPTTNLNQTLGHIQRGSLVLSAQWKPSNDVQVYAEGFSTQMINAQPVLVDVKLQYICPDPAQDTVYPGTNIISKSVSSCYNLTSNQDRHSSETTTQLASGVDWAATNNWDLTSEADVTLSKSRVAAIIVDDTYDIPHDGLNIITNYQGTGAHYITTAGNPQLNSSNLFIDQLFDSNTISKGAEWDWRADSTYTFASDSFIKDLVTGFRVADRSANNSGSNISSLNCITNSTPSSFYNAFIIAANNSPACTGPNGYVTQGSGGAGGTTPQAAAANYTNIGGYSVAMLAPNNAAAQTTSGLFFGGKFGESGITVVDTNWLWNHQPQVRSLFGYSNVPASGSITAGDYTNSGPPNNPANLFIVSEVSLAGYGKIDYGFNLLGFPVDGNLGLRFTDYTLTEQANNSNIVGTTLSFTPTRASHETSVFLPSFNARVTLDDGLYARFAASETATRPTFSQLNPATSYSIGGTTLQGSANSGNPNLTAEKSINLDGDLEYYWGKADHVSAAVFHRYVEGYIQTAAVGQVVVAGLTYNASKPVNYQNSYIDGVELAYSQFLDFLPGLWSGFGWDVNGTYISGRFNNITKWHYNAAGIYEKGPYSARISYTWSSAYLVNPTLVAGIQPPQEWANPRGNLDASFNYKWDDNLTITFDATNLNDGKYRAYDGAAPVGPAIFNMVDQRFDETYSVGLRYRM